MLDVANRVAMVSGGSRGIGKAIVEAMAEAGFRVSVGVRTPKKFQDQEGVKYFAYDAMDEETPATWLAQTIDTFGPPKALVNVAGISNRWSYQSADETALDLMWAVNVRGPARLTRHVLPHLRTCGDGRVVNIVSVAGKGLQHATGVGYAMTKHAMIAATLGVRREAFEEGVRATAICPGLVATDMTKSANTDRKMADPSDVAAAVVLALRMPNEAAIPEMIIDGKDRW
jgi:NAD(P)-dependent dehydrogenase (short-subunit alcohol dehydrogenase family)